MNVFAKIWEGLKLKPKSSTVGTELGDIEVNSTSSKLTFHNGTSSSPVVTESHAATLTNKTIDADSNTISNIDNADIKASAGIDATKLADGSVTNTELQYINSLTSNAQDQIDSKASTTALNDHINDATDAHDASAISVVPVGNIIATDAQAALQELDSDLTTVATDLNNHITDATDAHDASAISNVPSGNLVATDVQGALNELQSEVDTKVGASDTVTLTNKTINGDNNTLQDISITSLKTDLAAASTFISRDASGVVISTKAVPAGAVLGTSDAQVVTAKDIDGGTASNTSRMTVPKAAKATLDALTRKEATIVYASDTDKLYVDDGSTLKPVGSGSGGINFMNLTSVWSADNTDNVDAETSLGAWATFADAASPTPTDLTGGSPANVSISRTTTAGEVLDGTASFKLDKSANNSQGEGASCLFNVPPAYQGKFATITIPYKLLAGSVVSGDLSVWIYDVTNSVLITPLNQMIGGSSGTISATFPVTPSAGTPANQQYRVGIYFGSTSATAVTMVFDDVQVSPQQEVVVGNITPWQSYTPTFTGFGTVSTQTSRWRQVGESIEIESTFTAGTTTAVEARLSLPGSFVSASDYPSIQNVGSYTTNGAGFSNAQTNIFAEASVGYVTFAYSPGTAKRNGNDFAASGDVISVNATVRIENLEASVPTVIINPNIGPGQSYTPVVTGLGTVSGVSFEYRQVGEYLEIQGNLTSGTPSASPTTFTLPNAYVIASTVPSNSLVGSAVRDNAAGGDFTVVAVAAGDQTLGLGHNAAINPLAIQNGNAIIASGDLVSINCRIKVAGLSANGVINQGQIATLREEQTSGTNGGTFTSGSWVTRVLNTEIDPDGIVSLSSNQFTLQPGKYRINASAPGNACDQHKAKLVNITDTSDVIIGTSEYCQSGVAVQTRSIVSGTFTINAQKTFEIQHRCTTTSGSNGLGVQSGLATEVYTIVEIEKLR